MVVTTMNSQYEIDFTEERVRRVSGKNPSALEQAFGTQDGEWQSYVEAMRYPHGDDYFWMFYLTEGGYLRTSLVQSEED